MGIILSDFQGQMLGVSNYDLPPNAASEAVDCDFGGTVRKCRYYGTTPSSKFPVKIYDGWVNGDTPNKYMMSPMANDAAKRVYWLENGALVRGIDGSTSSPTTVGVEPPTGKVESVLTGSTSWAAEAVTSAYASVGRYGFGADANSIDTDGYIYWIQQLESGTMTAQEFINAFYAGIPAALLVVQAYASIGRTTIGTAPNQIDQPGFDYWVNRLNTGELTYERFMEYFYAGVGAMGDYTVLVTNMYNSVGRYGSGIDQAGFDYWISRLTSGALAVKDFPAAFYTGAKAHGYTVTEAQLSDAQSKLYSTTPVNDAFASTITDLKDGVTSTASVESYRSYIYTLSKIVSGDIVEESAPSEAVVIGPIKTGAPVVLKLTQAIPAGYYASLYRANSGRYLYVAAIQAGDVDFTDTIPDAALGEECPSINWTAPPLMDGIISAGYGFFIGWKGNSVYASELYLPHAWPAEYTYTVKYGIRRCVPVHGGILAITDNGNYFITGQSPSGISIVEMPTLYPCVSVNSAVDMGDGVVYVSPMGLALATPSGTKLLTEGSIDPIWWASQPLTGVIAYRVSSLYVFTLGNTRYVFDLQTGTMSTRLGLPLAATFDQATGDLRSESEVIHVSSFAPSFVWVSKVFEFNHLISAGWTQCIAAAYPVTVEWRLWKTMADTSGSYTSHPVSYQNHHPVRFPAGAWHRVQARITSANQVSKVVLTNTRSELEYVG